MGTRTEPSRNDSVMATWVGKPSWKVMDSNLGTKKMIFSQKSALNMYVLSIYDVNKAIVTV